MTAVILVGGYGTRLRPLTLSIPKPLVEFGHQSILYHQVEALSKVEVNRIILAINKQAKVLEDRIRTQCLKAVGDRLVELHFSYENEALGTSGPLKLIDTLLTANNAPFFLLNSDVICNYPFEAMMRFHKQHGSEGTMAITKVNEPCKYGAVEFDAKTGLISAFEEKPFEFVSNRINAGLYLLNPSVLKRIKEGPSSIEVDVFPYMVRDKALYCLEFRGFWMDIGQPTDYLEGLKFYLGYLYEKRSKLLASQPYTRGNVIIHPTARIGIGCQIGPNVTIGANATVGDGVALRNCAIFPGVNVKAHTWLNDCIIGWQSVIGSWVRIENCSVLGEAVCVEDELFLNGVLVLPHNHVTTSFSSPQILL